MGTFELIVVAIVGIIAFMLLRGLLGTKWAGILAIGLAMIVDYQLFEKDVEKIAEQQPVIQQQVSKETPPDMNHTSPEPQTQPTTQQADAPTEPPQNVATSSQNEAVTGIGTMFPIGADFAEIRQQRGEPIQDTSYLGSRYVDFAKESYFLDGNDKVSAILIKDSGTSIFNTHVGMTVSEIQQILGQPKAAYLDDIETGHFVTDFSKDGYSISFGAENETSAPFYVIIKHE